MPEAMKRAEIGRQARFGFDPVHLPLDVCKLTPFTRKYKRVMTSGRAGGLDKTVNRSKRF